MVLGIDHPRRHRLPAQAELSRPAPARPASRARLAGQAPPFGAADLAAVLATCHRPRPRGRGLKCDEVATRRGRVDAVIVGLAFMAGMRRSEVSALRWADVADAAAGDGILVTVRRSKTNQEGDVNDVRFVKGGVARAIRAHVSSSQENQRPSQRPNQRWLARTTNMSLNSKIDLVDTEPDDRSRRLRRRRGVQAADGNRGTSP